MFKLFKKELEDEEIVEVEEKFKDLDDIKARLRAKMEEKKDLAWIPSGYNKAQ